MQENEKLSDNLCLDCLVKLSDKNWYNSNQKDGYYICNDCNTKRNFNYNKNYYSTRYIVTVRNGKYVYLKGNKRTRPVDNRCELCTKINKMLGYHHWDDNNLLKGLWVCCRCHLSIIESFERLLKNENKVLLDKYLKLKKNMEEDNYGNGFTRCTKHKS